VSSALSPLVGGLQEAFQKLPGIGPRSAQRLAIHVLERDRPAGELLVESLQKALAGVGRCQQCRNLSDAPLCSICGDAARDRDTLCVVEGPMDVMAVEQTGTYRGRYFVLLGNLSPLDGIGPEELGLGHLLERLRDERVRELILATNATAEGQATAHYIRMMVTEMPLLVSRIAFGVPFGGELEYLNAGTLAQALEGRQPLENEA